MVRELAIFLYLFVFQLIFNFFKLFPLKNKVTFVVSFGDNSLSIYDEIKKMDSDIEVVILKKGSCTYPFDVQDKVINFETRDVVDMIKSIYHIATSNYIVVDNYYGFLANITFKPEVTCVQIWHAVGALKKFGLEDLSISTRSNMAKNRFKKVYAKFHKVIVGSDEMAKIFKKAFDVSSNSILKTGIPRTDVFYDEVSKEMIRNEIIESNPVLKGKKVLLYAPTYRDDNLDEFHIKLDIESMYKELSHEYVVVIKLHPSIRGDATKYEELFPGFVLDYSNYENLNNLLLITDILITDYSSIPFEYSLLKKPMLFYAYDLDEYQAKRGLPHNYLESVPGPVVYNTEEIIYHIKDNKFDLEVVEAFSKQWNEYSNGNSSKNVAQFILFGEMKDLEYTTREKQQVVSE